MAFKVGDQVKFTNPNPSAGINTSYHPAEKLVPEKIYTISKGNFVGPYTEEELITLEGFLTTWQAKSFHKI